jgi:dTDP-4-dehydrorhamnose reductase
MKILLTGVNGQVGFYINKKLSSFYEVFGVTREIFDLTNIDQMEKVIDDVKPDLIINPAAYTNVDQAEKEPELVFKTNLEGPKFLALKSKKLGIPLIQFSTDYIFDGSKVGAYIETDKAMPKSVYGKSKHGAEISIQEHNLKHIIIRTSWVYSLRGKNFLTTILDMAKKKSGFSIVSDQIGAPTSAIFIANSIFEIVKKIEQIEKNNLYGIYNLTCLGKASWVEFAKEIILNTNELGIELKCAANNIKPIQTTDFPTLAMRPLNSILNNEKLLKTFEIKCPEWQNELKIIIGNKCEYKNGY